MTSELRKKAYETYIKLVNYVASYKGSFEDLCNELNGFNVQSDYESFDANYGPLTVTVYNENGQYIVYEYVDVWDDEQESIVFEARSYTELLEE